MQVDLKTLLGNPLFDSFDEILISELLDPDKCTLVHYKKGALIVQEGEVCTSVGLVISGSLANQQLTPSGEILTIEMFEPKDAFGPALYSMQCPRYPFTLTATIATQVIYLPFDYIKTLIDTSPVFRENFIHFLSHRVHMFKEKLKMMQYKDVRSRLLHYLSIESMHAGQSSFTLRHTKSAIANMIGVARPSVSRELKHMADDGLIVIKGSLVMLLKNELS